jgi:hypothetical protein
MKTLIKSKALIIFVLASMLLVSCGKENTTSNTGNTFSNSWGVNGMGGVNAGFGGGSTGSQTLDMIFQQSTCQSSMGPNAYSILAVSNQGGATQPINPNLGDITNVYVGRNLFGDVVVLRSMGTYAELIVKVCARSFLVGQGIQMGLQSAGGFVVNASRYCSVNEITKGNVLVRFTSPQGGNYDLPILPSALHLHTPLSPVCSGQM